MATSDSDSDATYDPLDCEQSDLAQDKIDCEDTKFVKAATSVFNYKHNARDLHEISESDSDDERLLKTRPVMEGGASGSLLNKPSTSRLSKDIVKPPCKYGLKCYRKNPAHFDEFSHPTNSVKSKRADESVTGQQSSCSAKRMKTGENVGNVNTSFGFYLTKVKGIKEIYNQAGCMHIKDILSEDHGILLQSAQFNYMFEVDWLMHQYPAEFRDKPLLLIHGMERADKADIDLAASKWPNVRLCQAKLEIPFGTHHTKMMLLLYNSGLRVVIHTSNLISNDWNQKTQGIWMSPIFPRLSTESDCQGDSLTGFKIDLLQYLEAYKSKGLIDWVRIVKEHDLSSAKVFLIASVPGRHSGISKHSFGHLKLRKVLEKHGPVQDAVKSWPVIGQFSSIGSLGSSPDQWLCGEWYTSLSSAKHSGTSLGGKVSNLKLIYPSKENVRLSLEGYPAGGSLPYSVNVAKKQPYLNAFLHQWKADVRGRSAACPHIKTYCRAASDGSQLAWFLVTSANLSKAAWGALEKQATQLMIRSYEIGVLFLPEFCASDKAATFTTRSSLKSFPLPYDLPATPYNATDRPWLWDISYTDKPDTHGCSWNPC